MVKPPGVRRTRYGNFLKLVMAEDFSQKAVTIIDLRCGRYPQRSSRILLNAPRAWQHGGNDAPSEQTPRRAAWQGWDVGSPANRR
jgi:hypothetical protein